MALPTIWRKSLLSCASLVLVSAIPALADLQLSVIPMNQQIGVGDVASVNLVVSGLDPRPPELAAFDIFITFDPMVLSLPGVVFGNLLGDPLTEALTSVAGGTDSIELAEVSLLTNAQLDALQSASFVIANLQFQAIGPGVSSIDFTKFVMDDGDGNKLAFSGVDGSIRSVVPEPRWAWIGAICIVGLASRRLRLSRRLPVILCGVGLIEVAAKAQAPPPLPVQRVCISVFRYGGAASGWIGGGAGNFSSGTFKSITAHLNRANAIFNAPAPRPMVEWVWGEIIEDLPDLFGMGNGDITWMTGPPGEGDDREIRLDENAPTGSPDIDQIIKYTRDAECYPVVFVNGGLGSAGLTYVEPDPQFTCLVNGQQQNCNIGKITFIDTSSFPRTEVPTTARLESNISTLGHEFGHAVCLDPTSKPNPPDPKTPEWGDATGHPPRKQGLPPTTPEGIGFRVNDPTKTDNGQILRLDLMWFTGTQRSGAEQFTARQAGLANFCAGLLRGRRSPSFSVAPGGPSNLDPNPLFYAPATPLNMPNTPPVVVFPGVDLSGISYSRAELLPGRFPFKFVVSSNSKGLPGSDVAAINDRGSTEFAAPINLKGNTNIAILGTRGFGLLAGDQIDALEKEPPSAVDFFRAGFVTPPFNGTQRVYFTAALGATLDPATIYLAKAQWVNNNQFIQRTFLPYAQPFQLGLGPGDEISTICVKSTSDMFVGGDLVFFALRSNSTLVKNGVIDSASILAATGNGFIEVQNPAQLGLLPTDEIRGLKCFAAPKPCDINGDGNVNTDDIEAIFQARNMPAVPGDPRDVDGDGVITVNDARICTERCDKPKCAK